MDLRGPRGPEAPPQVSPRAGPGNALPEGFPRERLHYLDRVQDRTAEIAEEIVGSLVERLGAKRGALVLRGREGDSRVVAAREQGGRSVDPSDFSPPEQAMDTRSASTLKRSYSSEPSETLTSTPSSRRSTKPSLESLND